MLVLLISLIWLRRYGLFKTAPRFFFGMEERGGRGGEGRAGVGEGRGGRGREDGCEKNKVDFFVSSEVYRRAAASSIFI